ncbi:MAG: DUF1499 domain-containing protein [Planctomycetaceae bacterium]|nr:DUF1499 domain-containing protein [Planctomycetaceae bacterium]
MSLFSHRPDDLGITNGQLKKCPSTPNCVGSWESPDDGEHFIAPLSVPSSLEKPMAKLREVLNSLPRTTIVSDTDDYLHVEFTTALMRFVDDVEFQWLPSEQVIHVRSASRIGRSDLGTNRTRVEKIRKLWESALN